MNEQQLKHGARLHHPLIHKWIRWNRPSYSKHLAKRRLFGGASLVNWTTGYSSPHGAIKNQQQSDSCGGMAGSYAIEIMQLLQGKPLNEISAKSIYSPIAYPGGGTTVSALEQQLEGSGANLEASVPDIAPDGTCTEAFMTDKSWITPQMLADAATRAGYTAMSVDINQEAIAEATQNEGFVIVIAKGQDGNVNSWLSYTPDPPQPNNANPIWGHFLCVFSFLQTDQQLNQFLNSWGMLAGKNGVQAFTNDYIQSGIVDAFTLVADSKIVPTAGSNSFLAYLWSFFEDKPIPVSV